MAGELDPRTRREVFLSGMLYGDPSELPDPETRDELYMKAIAENIVAGGLPDTSEASAGDTLVLDSDKNPTWGSGATPKYVHNISLGYDSAILTTSIVNDSSTPFTTATFYEYVNNNNYIGAVGVNRPSASEFNIYTNFEKTTNPSYVYINGINVSHADGGATVSNVHIFIGTSVISSFVDNVISI